jgi:hypothetical protein
LLYHPHGPPIIIARVLRQAGCPNKSQRRSPRHSRTGPRFPRFMREGRWLRAEGRGWRSGSGARGPSKSRTTAGDAVTAASPANPQTNKSMDHPRTHWIRDGIPGRRPWPHPLDGKAVAREKRLYIRKDPCVSSPKKRSAHCRLSEHPFRSYRKIRFTFSVRMWYFYCSCALSSSRPQSSS